MLDYSSSISLRVLEVFTAAWCFVMGSVIGSFLNVVIYRMPLGLSISKPKSRCPVCKTPICARDNLPILGWIMLRGKCRHCQTSISVRYPVVEIMVGTFFLLLYLSLVYSGGHFLPYRVPNQFWGAYQIIEGRVWDLIALYVYYCYLFIVVLATAFIQFDRQTVPRRLLIWCFLAGSLAGLFLPELHPVPVMIPAQSELTLPFASDNILVNSQYFGSLHWGIERQTLITLCWGAFYGAIIGFLFTWPSTFQKEESKNLYPPGTVSLLVLTGLYLGWQQVITNACLAALCLACFEFACKLRKSKSQLLPVAAFLAAVLVLQLLLGKYLTLLSLDADNWVYLMLTGGQVIAIPILAGIAQYAYITRIFHDTAQDQISLDESSTLSS